jgi:hypothetical protein
MAERAFTATGKYISEGQLVAAGAGRVGWGT